MLHPRGSVGSGIPEIKLEDQFSEMRRRALVGIDTSSSHSQYNPVNTELPGLRQVELVQLESATRYTRFGLQNVDLCLYF